MTRLNVDCVNWTKGRTTGDGKNEEIECNGSDDSNWVVNVVAGAVGNKNIDAVLRFEKLGTPDEFTVFSASFNAEHLTQMIRELLRIKVALKQGVLLSVADFQIENPTSDTDQGETND